jgi:hypothetical protein
MEKYHHLMVKFKTFQPSGIKSLYMQWHISLYIRKQEQLIILPEKEVSEIDVNEEKTPRATKVTTKVNLV